MGQLMELRPQQTRAMDMLRASLRSGHKRPIIQAATGFGKTVIAAHIVSGAREKGKRIAFCVPALSLIDQTFDRFAENGVEASEMGVMQGDHPWRRPSAPVQICSVQTIASRGWPEVDVVVIDEVHLRFKAVDEWMAAEPNKVFIGLSATPWSRGLADHWDDLLVPTSIGELIDAKLLAPFKAFAPAHVDLKGIKTVAGDYHEGQLSSLMSKKSIVADVVQTWLNKAERRPTLVFAVDRAHAAILHDQFEQAGVSSAYVDANTSREDRAELAKKFQSGLVEVICSVGTMTTGVDLDVRCIVLARPTKSEILFVQMVGRGLRTAKGKDHLLLLDHSDNHMRLGMVTDIKHEHLIGGKGSKEITTEGKEKLPKDCPKCAFLVPVGVFECPNCGYKPKRPQSVEVTDGELVELQFAAKVKRKDNRDMTVDEKARFFGELKRYAIENKYKEGWASMKYKDKFGVWPNDPRVRNAPVRPVSPGVRNWVISQNIKWAKSRSRRSVDDIINESIGRAYHA